MTCSLRSTSPVGPGGDEPAEVEHRGGLAAGRHEAHVVVDEDHQRADLLGDAPDDMAEVLGLLVGQAGRGLVEEHEPGRADDGAGDLDEPPLAGAERATCGFASRSSPTKSMASMHLWRRRGALAAGVLEDQQHVVEHGQVRRSPARSGTCGAPPSGPGGSRPSPAGRRRRPARAPAIGRTNPLSTLKNVVLPAPFGPISPQVPAGERDASSGRSGSTPPKRTVRPSTSITRRPAPRRRLRRGHELSPMARAQLLAECPSAPARRGHPARSAAPGARRCRTGS